MEDTVKASLAVILQYGLLGALFVLALISIYFLATGRLKDWKELGKIVTDFALVRQEATSTSQALNDALSSWTESGKLAAAANLTLAENINGFRSDIKAEMAANRTEMAQVRAEVSRMRDVMNQAGLRL